MADASLQGAERAEAGGGERAIAALYWSTRRRPNDSEAETPLNDVLAYIDQQRDAFQADLKELLRIPSVSADPAFKGDVRRAGEWVRSHLAKLGLKAELIETGGHPIIYAESAPVPGKPVALVYGHYDVQPPDPLDEWTTPPFEPTERDGKLFARGATDDKGQMLTHVKSVEAWLATAKNLPLQVKLLIEGEEEVGSEHLERFLKENAQRLACDCVVISDTAQFAPGVPAITYGLRGITYFELKLTGPKQDLHSGVFGGGVTNPANALAKMLAALIDGDGRVTIPGFYEDVTPLTAEERAEFAALPFDETAFKQQLGVAALSGEAGFSTLERRWARPTFDVNGLTSGYQGEGAKTVLPARASAKLSFRLVPNQEPKKIAIGLRQRLAELTPPGIRMELVEHHGAPGVVMPLDSPYLQAAASAIEAGFGRRPVFIREGGSIPIVNTFADVLKADVLLLGWGQNDDNPHSPNEKFSLEDFHRGIRASAALWGELASLKTGS
jgi:acetylornithine deacetylase/succinyl-diaminopimelate desuccinylase-like protein